MKSKVYATTLLLAAFSLAGAIQAQDTVAPAPATRPEAPTPPAAPQPPAIAPPGATPVVVTDEAAPDNPFRQVFDQAKRAAEQARLAADQVRQEAARVKDQAEYAAKEALDSLDSAMAGGGQWSSAPSAALPGMQPGFWSDFGGRAESGTLVIRTTEPDPNALAHSEEDLNIMGRILDKAVTQDGEDDQPQAMGIRLISLNHSALRNLQIEGFGDVFFLNVNFPLVGPARNTTGNNDEKPASNSTWDEAKRELYGPAPGAEGSNENSSKEAYDPKRVEKLKDMLLQALKNATNIRSLKSDESVMVVVNGSNGGGWRVSGMNHFQNRLKRLSSGDQVGGSGGGGGTGGGAGRGGQAGYAVLTQSRVHTGSVLTLQAKKTDIDAFAAGKLDLREFRNKVKMLAYPTISGANSDDEQVLVGPQKR